MSSTVLVTGATGFVGTPLVRELRQAGHTVVCHSIEDGDIAVADLKFSGVRHVFHLAARTFVPESWEAPRPFYEVNLLGTVNVLEFCRREGASLTLISSYVYGKPRSLPISEVHPLQPLNPYSHTKILAEETARYYAAQFGVSVTIVRPFNIYGPGQEGRFLVPTLVQQAIDPHADRIVVADLRPRRDYVYISDVVRLVLATLGCAPGSVFNVGSGASTSIGDLVELINDCVPVRKQVISEDRFRPDEILDVVADVTRARRELGWEPRVGLPDGIRETVNWALARSG